MTSPGGARRAPSRRVGLRAATAGRPATGARSARRTRRPRPVGRVLGVGLALVCLWLPGLVEPAPDAPADLTVSAKDAVVTASWEGRPADSFRVEYAEDPTFDEATTTTTVDDTSVELTELEPGTTYYLRVRTVRPDGNDSTPTAPVAFDTTFPNDPPKVKVSSNSSTTVRGSWKGGGDDARYETQLSTTIDFVDPETDTTAKSARTYKGLEPNSLYAVRARIVDEDGEALSTWSDPAILTTAAYEPLGVGTYNVLKWRDANWSARRTVVADLIKDSHVDVIGLQEAVPSRIAGRGIPQYQDIANLLGPDWALSRSTKDATGEVRIAYDTTEVELIEEGYRGLSGSSRFRGIQRYVAWSVFEQRTTGKRFLFVNTHFTPGGGGSAAAQRNSEARQLASIVQTINDDDLPVVVVGDFNAGGSRVASNPIYGAIIGAGLVDPLVRSGELGEAEKRVDADLTTFNGLSRTPPRRANPRFIDHIFVSPMRVSQWQVAANLDAAGRWIGTIPSDHHLIRATVYLP